MKIEIEFDSSFEAKITCDGREFRYGIKDGCCWGWDGFKKVTKKFDEQDQTIGGIVLCKLAEHMSDILQGWMPEFDNQKTGECYKTWEKLDDESQEAVYDRVNKW